MKKFDGLIKRILLDESPVFVDKPLPISLNDRTTNKETVNKSIQDGEKINSFDGREVYKIVVNNFVYFCFIKNGVADAYVEFFVDNKETNSKRVLQRKSEDSKGLLRNAFLNYFSHIFSSIKLDQTANVHGKQFFKKLLKEATERGFKTTVVNEETNEEASYNDEDFEQYWSGQTIINNKQVNPNDLLFKIYYK